MRLTARNLFEVGALPPHPRPNLNCPASPGNAQSAGADSALAKIPAEPRFPTVPQVHGWLLTSATGYANTHSAVGPALTWVGGEGLEPPTSQM